MPTWRRWRRGGWGGGFFWAPGPGGAGWRGGGAGIDPVRLGLIRLVVLVHFVVALLDIGRFHWSDSVPRALQVTAFAALAGAVSWVLWAVSVNRFFVPQIRIQSERGHGVVSSGPYSFVR